MAINQPVNPPLIFLLGYMSLLQMNQLALSSKHMGEIVRRSRGTLLTGNVFFDHRGISEDSSLILVSKRSICEKRTRKPLQQQTRKIRIEELLGSAPLDYKGGLKALKQMLQCFEVTALQLHVNMATLKEKEVERLLRSKLIEKFETIVLHDSKDLNTSIISKLPVQCIILLNSTFTADVINGILQLLVHSEMCTVQLVVFHFPPMAQMPRAYAVLSGIVFLKLRKDDHERVVFMDDAGQVYEITQRSDSKGSTIIINKTEIPDVAHEVLTSITTFNAFKDLTGLGFIDQRCVEKRMTRLAKKLESLVEAGTVEMRNDMAIINMNKIASE